MRLKLFSILFSICFLENEATHHFLNVARKKLLKLAFEIISEFKVAIVKYMNLPRELYSESCQASKTEFFLRK